MLMNLITGAIALGIFAAFVVGLADSIHTWPFWVIVAMVVTMAAVDFWESVKSSKEGSGDTTTLS
ncbi:MAG: hypothetical protein ACPGOV_16455 [Magnetovibrionaceae bacterium]